jgi:hypothetical protein
MINKQDYYKGYSVEDISAGDEIPVILNGNRPTGSLRADFNACEDFLSRAQDILGKNTDKIEGIGQWLGQYKTDLDPNLFVKLWSIQLAIEKNYPEASAKAEQDDVVSSSKRQIFNSSTMPALSDVLKEGYAQCPEYSLLAHAALNRLGVQNQYMVGAMAFDQDDYACSHAYILIPQKDKLIVYDPTNPIRTEQSTFPSIYEATAEQAAAWQANAKDRRSLMALKNLLTGKEAYFGSCDQTTMIPDRDFVYPNGKMTPG